MELTALRWKRWAGGLGEAGRLVPAPGVERVVERAFQLDLSVVLFAVDDRKAVGDRFQAGGLRRHLEVGGHIGPLDDQGQAFDPRVLQAVLDNALLKSAPAFSLSPLHPPHLLPHHSFTLPTAPPPPP